MLMFAQRQPRIIYVTVLSWRVARQWQRAMSLSIAETGFAFNTRFAVASAACKRYAAPIKARYSKCRCADRRQRGERVDSQQPTGIICLAKSQPPPAVENAQCCLRAASRPHDKICAHARAMRAHFTATFAVTPLCARRAGAQIFRAQHAIMRTAAAAQSMRVALFCACRARDA